MSQITTETTPDEMEALLAAQRGHLLTAGAPDAATRRARLTTLIDLVVENEPALVSAMSEDFGNRSAQTSILADLMATLAELKYARKHLHKWMKAKRVRTEFPFGLIGAKAWVEYQPLGVVGIVSPWNFPIYLTLAPLAGVLAAGNSAMIKPSELTPKTSALMADLIHGAFAPEVIAVVQGGVEVARGFTALAFDHLLFTGSTGVAHHVLHAAADNLVPVTLELGGKSPVVLSQSADMALAARRIAQGKLFNAGQVCLAPDYLMVPEGRLDEMVERLSREMARLYPSLVGNADYTSIANDKAFARLDGMVEEAKAQGARVVEVNPKGEDLRAANTRLIAPTLVVNPDPGLAVMREEIFGPILPIITYADIDAAIAQVNAGPRPLALYYFGQDRAEEARVLARTTTGGVCLNDVVMHAAQVELPFGGVGSSGMGNYHGIYGFRTFSHEKAIYRQTGFDRVFNAIRPPYGRWFDRFIRPRMKR